MNREKTPLQSLGWTRPLWLVALIFLVNPYFHGYDVLPDFVGYALLLRGISRVACLDESFGEAARLFRRLLWLSVARLIALVWVIAVPSMEEQPTLILLLCFVVGVLELMLVLPACTQLFRGLSYVASRMGGVTVLRSTREETLRKLRARLDQLDPSDPAQAARRQSLEARMKQIRAGQDITSLACRRTQIFAVVKVAMCVLPELAALTDASYRVGATTFNWYFYINGFRGMGMLVVLAVGIVWLARMIFYCRRIEADHTLWETLAQKCDEDREAHPERVPQRDLKIACALVLIAFVFLANFFVEYVNFLPGFVASALLLAALIPLRRYLSAPVKIASTAVFVAHAVISAVSYVATVRFFETHHLSAYHRVREVMMAYDRLCLIVIIESVLTVAVFAMLSVMTLSLIRRYTGSHDAASFGYTREQIVRLRRRELCLHLLPILVLGVLGAAAHAVYFCLLPVYDFVILIDLAPWVLLLFVAYMRLNDLPSELDTAQMSR